MTEFSFLSLIDSVDHLSTKCFYGYAMCAYEHLPYSCNRCNMMWGQYLGHGEPDQDAFPRVN